MTFAQQLNEYITRLQCSGKELSLRSGISESTLSRYRGGVREPLRDSRQIADLARGLAALAAGRDVDLSGEEILRALTDALQKEQDRSALTDKLPLLMRELDLSVGELARRLNYDASHVSRILSGQRRASDGFITQTARFLAQRYASKEEVEVLAGLLDCDPQTLAREQDRAEVLASWLGTAEPLGPGPVDQFLEKLDAFNLDDYIQAIRFDDIKVPSAPFRLPANRRYQGLDEMMESEIDFIKATVLSKSREDLILYSDMPLGEMARDPEFPKKWMYGTAVMLKKGLHMHMIHDVNRPFTEMMLGLESWIPMYMTGQISPYYLRASQSGVFLHLLKVSGAAALQGETIAGHQAQGRYYFTNNREEVRYYRARAEQLLDKALPLMEIYRSERAGEFSARLRSLAELGDRRMIFCSLPVFTISPELLEALLRRNQVPEELRNTISSFAEGYRREAERAMTERRFLLELPRLSREDFEKHPLALSLSECFIEREIGYTYEEYTAHLAETLAFAEKQPNCQVTLNERPAFRNINITVIAGKTVVVSKNKSPVIHFVIRHPNMVAAFEQFAPAVVD